MARPSRDSGLVQGHDVAQVDFPLGQVDSGDRWLPESAEALTSLVSSWLVRVT